MIDAFVTGNFAIETIVILQSIIVPAAYELFARYRTARERDLPLEPELEQFYEGIRRKWAVKAIAGD